MRILVVHNSYQQRGGEDTVVEAEIALLQSNGHEVETYLRSNDSVKSMSALSLAKQSLWSTQTTHDLAALIGQFQPELIHAHNTFPLVSPSLYWAASWGKLPLVQTLHNFRVTCLNALLLREGKVCEDCVGHLPWRGVVRACYRESRAASSVLAGMLILHRSIGTWQNKVTRYIALNEFCRQKFIAAGLPSEKISIKPNFVDFDIPVSNERHGFLFVGRLSAEKGIGVLVNAATALKTVSVRVAGDGPEMAAVLAAKTVVVLGALDSDAVRHEMSKAMALVLPSIWFENFPRTLVEAFACGLPVIASRVGALAELVEEGVTGLLFEPGDSVDLVAKMQWAQLHPTKMAEMGCNARALYAAKYTGEKNHRQLMAIYRDAIAANQSKADA